MSFEVWCSFPECPVFLYTSHVPLSPSDRAVCLKHSGTPNGSPLASRPHCPDRDSRRGWARVYSKSRLPRAEKDGEALGYRSIRAMPGAGNGLGSIYLVRKRAGPRRVRKIVPAWVKDAEQRDQILKEHPQSGRYFARWLYILDRHYRLSWGCNEIARNWNRTTAGRDDKITCYTAKKTLHMLRRRSQRFAASTLSTTAKIAAAKELFAGGARIREVAKVLGISRSAAGRLRNFPQEVSLPVYVEALHPVALAGDEVFSDKMGAAFAQPRLPGSPASLGFELVGLESLCHRIPKRLFTP